VADLKEKIVGIDIVLI